MIALPNKAQRLLVKAGMLNAAHNMWFMPDVLNPNVGWYLHFHDGAVSTTVNSRPVRITADIARAILLYLEADARERTEERI